MTPAHALLPERDEHGRPRVELHQAAGHDADNAGMPVRIGQDQGRRAI